MRNTALHGLRLVGLAFLTAGAAACGDDVDDVRSSGGAGGTSGAGTSTAASTTTATTASGDVGPPCSGFDPGEAQPVVVRLSNPSDTDIYLSASCNQITGLVLPAQDDGLSYADPVCTCGTVLREGENACIAAGCIDDAYLLPARSTREFTWSGRAYARDEVPAECNPDLTDPAPCANRVDAPAGTYEVRVEGFDACDGSGGGECVCDNQGFCEGAPTGREAGYARPTFTFPSEREVELDFGVCPFGCASP